MFKVGQKVVCVEPIDTLVMYEIYTVESINDFYGNIGVVLVEDKSIFSLTGGYWAYRFRPLDETFATEVLEQIKEQIEQEELVLI